MLIFLATLLATVSSILRSRAALELENLALRHQIGVLQRSARKPHAHSPRKLDLSVSTYLPLGDLLCAQVLSEVARKRRGHFASRWADIGCRKERPSDHVGS